MLKTMTLTLRWTLGNLLNRKSPAVRKRKLKRKATLLSTKKKLGDVRRRIQVLTASAVLVSLIEVVEVETVEVIC
jgi:hypothetical protein